MFLKLLLVLHEPDGWTESVLVSGVCNLDYGAITHWVPAGRREGLHWPAGCCALSLRRLGCETQITIKKILITCIYEHMCMCMYVIL